MAAQPWLVVLRQNREIDRLYATDTVVHAVLDFSASNNWSPEKTLEVMITSMGASRAQLMQDLKKILEEQGPAPLVVIDGVHYVRKGE